MNTNRTKILTAVASVLIFAGVTGPACSDDGNEGPTTTPVIGGEDAGPDGNGGQGNGNGGQGNGGHGTVLEDGGIVLADGGIGSPGGNTGNGGNGGNTYLPDSGIIVQEDGGIIIVDPCPVPLGEDGCFNCPATTDDSEQFLNQCTESDFSTFDNEDRIPHLELYGTL